MDDDVWAGPFQNLVPRLLARYVRDNELDFRVEHCWTDWLAMNLRMQDIDGDYPIEALSEIGRYGTADEASAPRNHASVCQGVLLSNGTARTLVTQPSVNPCVPCLMRPKDNPDQNQLLLLSGIASGEIRVSWSFRIGRCVCRGFALPARFCLSSFECQQPSEARKA